MVFTADLSNSCITMAVYDLKGSMLFRSEISSDRNKSVDEYYILLINIFSIYNIEPDIVEGAIISSVVPPLTYVFGSAAERLLGCKPLFVGPGIKTGLDIKIDHHSQLGSDLVANTVAALAAFPKPFIIIDLDTATTITAVNAKGELCGVIIMPGVRISLDALSANAAELPYISLDHPNSLLGTNTVDSMNSGVIYGTSCMLDGLIDRLIEEFNGAEINIIATGSLINHILPYCRHNIVYAPNLTLDGLYIIYKKNLKRYRQT